MPSIRLEDLTPFGRLALRLDREFSELACYGGEIARVDIESDNGGEASRSNFKRLERQADSVVDSLQASLRKISGALASDKEA